MSLVPTLGSWDARGVTEPIRHLLKYAGVKFYDKRYAFCEGTTMAEICKYWYADKFNIGLDFPNLPYYFEGDLKLTQSVTILRYLARKYGLFASDEKSLAQQDLIEQQLRDIRYNFIMDVNMDKEQFEKNKEKFLSETLPQHFDQLSKFLGQNEWFVGKITYVDFLAYELFDLFREFSSSCLDKYENLQQYMIRFESLPAIAAYLKSSEFRAWPLVGPIRCWGYRKQ